MSYGNDDYPEAGMKKKRNPALSVFLVIFLIILAAVAAAGIFLETENFQKGFLRKTTLNGVDISHKTVQEAAKLIEDRFGSCRIVLRERGKEAISGTLMDFGYTLDRNNLEKELERCRKEQRLDIETLVQKCLYGTRLVSDMPAVRNEDVFNAKVCASSLPDQRVPNTNAELIYDENTRQYSIKPEVLGNEFADADLQDYVRKETEVLAAYGREGEVLTLDVPDSVYILPEIRTDDPGLILQRDTYNRYCASSVTYQFGSVTETLDWNTVKDWIVFANGQGYLDESRAAGYVADLAARYDTQYVDRTFHTSVGTDIVIPGGRNEYGYTIRQEDETAQLMADLNSNTSVTREPLYIETNSYGNQYHLRREGRDDLAGTYVEVNISMQHVWFYKNGQLITESDCVTGCVANGTETNTGVYPLAYKESPSVLTGGNAEGGYSTPVSFWMPFTEGQGLHDATWRGSFGGSIYQYSGSHGCVNLPYWAAETIYENIETATPIVIYK